MSEKIENAGLQATIAEAFEKFGVKKAIRRVWTEDEIAEWHRREDALDARYSCRVVSREQ